MVQYAIPFTRRGMKVNIDQVNLVLPGQTKNAESYKKYIMGFLKSLSKKLQL